MPPKTPETKIPFSPGKQKRRGLAAAPEEEKKITPKSLFTTAVEQQNMQILLELTKNKSLHPSLPGGDETSASQGRQNL